MWSLDGTLTSMESLVAAVDSNVCEPVHRSEAARHGWAGEDEATDGVLLELVRLIRAVSWLSDGGCKLAGVQSGLGACMEAHNDWPNDGLDILLNINIDVQRDNAFEGSVHHMDNFFCLRVYKHLAMAYQCHHPPSP